VKQFFVLVDPCAGMVREKGNAVWMKGSHSERRDTECITFLRKPLGKQSI
jgi:hypothetical protein